MKRISFQTTNYLHWPAGIIVIMIMILILGLFEYASPQAYDDIKVGWDNQRHLYHAIEARNISSDVCDATEINIDQHGFKLYSDGTNSVIESDQDLVLKPAVGTKIVPSTEIKFLDEIGDKIRFYANAYKIGVSPYTLDITSDRNVKFHSDTVSDLMVILGDQGDVVVKQDVYTGGAFRAGTGGYRFTVDGVGDKYFLYGTLYKLAISPSSIDYYSDWYHRWHSDTNQDAMVLDANTGNLSIEGMLTAPMIDNETFDGNIINGTTLSGNAIYGNIVHATEVTFTRNDFKLYTNDNYAIVESSRDLLLKPIGGAKIIPATMMEFFDDVGDKIRFYSHSYKVGISPQDLDITSDQNIKFHSDTNEDAMVLNGDSGDLTIEGAFTAVGQVRSNSGFNISGTAGYSGTISPASTIVVSGGLIVGAY